MWYMANAHPPPTEKKISHGICIKVDQFLKGTGQISVVVSHLDYLGIHIQVTKNA